MLDQDHYHAINLTHSGNLSAYEISRLALGTCVSISDADFSPVTINVSCCIKLKLCSSHGSTERRLQVCNFFIIVIATVSSFPNL